MVDPGTMLFRHTSSCIFTFLLTPLLLFYKEKLVVGLNHIYVRRYKAFINSRILCYWFGRKCLGNPFVTFLQLHPVKNPREPKSIRIRIRNHIRIRNQIRDPKPDPDLKPDPHPKLDPDPKPDPDPRQCFKFYGPDVHIVCFRLSFS